eukprot:TRINITY_DN28108_c0_g1_i3.p1 TRINITY_DN28108_c0_g1~~TRINITY_DN28108_c0_g1_i3.p1  ORF type:complete len:353 (-),score=48.28 TRINITY_DN28108_c0_g1_i3:11-1069(-)
MPYVPPKDDVSVFGIPLHNFSPATQFGICFVGVLGFYLLYAVLQEFLFTNYADFHFGWFLTFFQYLVYGVFAGVHRLTARSSKNLSPPQSPTSSGSNGRVAQQSIRGYFVLALFMVFAMGFANQALVHLTYPTQVLFKSCKLLAVMTVGFVASGKRYSVIEVFSALCLVLGLITLSTANSKTALRFDWLGVAMISGSLLCDGLSGNVQEYVLQQTSASVVDTIYYSYSIGAGYLFVVCLAVGQLGPAVAFLANQPTALGVMLGFCVIGYAGVHFFMALMKLFGAVTAIVITSVRKVITILLSFLLFPKPFTPFHLLAIVLVCCGVGMDLWYKHSRHPAIHRRTVGKSPEEIV